MRKMLGEMKLKNNPSLNKIYESMNIWLSFQGPAAQLRAVANKHKSNLRFSLNNLSINLKYFFQVGNIV